MFGRPPANNPNLAPLGPRGGGVGGVGAPGAPAASQTVFVGSITPGISDSMLTQLLSTCGHLVTLKRISPAFGFATFDHPEAVMRAIELLNGLELPQPGGASDGAAAKKLLVKADEKTKAFVDQYTADRGDNRATDEEHRDATGKEAIAAFVETLRRPDVLSLFPDAGAAPGARQGGVAAHLKDLPPEDLPEEHRSSVLGEIDKFRQASAAREDEKRRREQIMERERLAGPSSSSSPAYPSGTSGMRDPRDPQSYNHGAPSFVRANGAAAPAAPPIRREDLDPEAADEEEEQRRISSKHSDEARRAEAASSAYQHQERARLNHWTRVLDESNAEAARKARAADGLAHRLSNWDEEEERSREIFYTDRRRWRQHRAVALRREMEDDAADERREVAEEEKRRQDEEKARVRREEEEKKMREEQRKAGVLLGEHAPLKLKSHVNEAGGAGPAAAAAAAPVAAFSSADDGGGESSRARKNMAGILDDVPATNGSADASERRTAVRAALEEVDSTDLFSGNGPSTTRILWPHLSQPALSSYVAKLVEEMVGEAVPELQEVVVEKVAQCKGEDAGLAKSIEDTVQPVLAEEAGIFTEKLWRWLVEETQVAAAASAS